MPTTTSVRPLSASESAVWRAFVRAVYEVPRVLENDLVAEQSMTMSEYLTLMMLSEAPDRTLRMAALADRATLSPSRMSRLVDAFVERGWVQRTPCPSDGRGFLATLTDAGLARLEEAYPTHLASVRRAVIDHLGDVDLERLARTLGRFAPSADACPSHSST